MSNPLQVIKTDSRMFAKAKRAGWNMCTAYKNHEISRFKYWRKQFLKYLKKNV